MRCAADDVPGALVDGELVPDWLTAADAPWLRELLLATAAFHGRPFAELRVRWRTSAPPPRAGERWRHVLAAVRERLLPRSARATSIRAAVFAASASGANRSEALAAGAAAGGLPEIAVEAAMFADLGDQRLVQWPRELDVDTVRRATNGRFAAALLATANAAELALHGASRAALRTAWLHGAHFRCVTTGVAGAHLRWLPPPGDARAGRRLGAIVPVLAWAQRFELRAQCRWRGARARLVLSTLDALPVGAPVAPFDSRFEREVAAALARELVGWEVVREPAPVVVGERLAFPDFGLLRRDGAGEAWWVELAGLRDPAALPGKLELLAKVPRYVLCLPERVCPPAWAGHLRVVPFPRSRRVPALVAVVRSVVSGSSRID